jgi:hypothetical protein
MTTEMAGSFNGNMMGGRGGCASREKWYGILSCERHA